MLSPSCFGLPSVIARSEATKQSGKEDWIAALRSEWRKSRGAGPGLIRQLAGRLDPALDHRLVILGPIFRQPFGVDPGPVQALHPEMVLRPEPRRIVERADGEIHLVAVRKFEAERGPAGRAIRPASDRRARVPVGPALPGHVGLLHALERDRDAAGRPLAHPAMAEIGVIIMDLRRVAHLPAGAAARHLVRHSITPSAGLPRAAPATPPAAAPGGGCRGRHRRG